jgi:ribosomal protein L2
MSTPRWRVALRIVLCGASLALTAGALAQLVARRAASTVVGLPSFETLRDLAVLAIGLLLAALLDEIRATLAGSSG